MDAEKKKQKLLLLLSSTENNTQIQIYVVLADCRSEVQFKIFL